MNTIGHEQIELRAYQFWGDRGRPWGSPETDWFQAEQALAGEGESGFTKLAREVGNALGQVVALVADPLRH